MMNIVHRLAAFGALFARYCKTFAYFWRIRHSLRTDFFNQQEAAFLPASLSLQETPVSPTLRWTAWLLMALILFSVLWAILGQVDIVVNATGKVIPSGRVKTIGSVDVASVQALYVHEGQAVRAGDLLIALDSSSSDAEHDKAADAVAVAKCQAARALALQEAIKHFKTPQMPAVPEASEQQWQVAQQHLAAQYHDFITKLTRLNNQIDRYNKALPLATQRAADYEELQVDQTVSRHAWLEKEQVKIDLQGQLADATDQRKTLISQTLKEANDTLAEAHKVIEASRQDQRRAGAHSRLLKLTAPVDGTVQQLAVHTVGGVVPAAQPLMQIVPAAQVVEVEAFLENKDVGFVRPGQAAEVKVDTYDYTKYGSVHALVKQVSRDAIQDEKRGLIYSTKVVLDQGHILIDGRRLPLNAGMSVSVEIKTGTRRVIEYLLSPLIRHQREAIRER